MDGNGTDTWVIVLAAFGGGLAGAILQPGASYVMDRLRGKDQRRKAVERNLRRMLTMWLEFATRGGLTAAEICSKRDLGRTALSDAEVMQRLRVAEQAFPTWQGERIRDAELRSLAERLYTLSVSLHIRLIDPNQASTLDALIPEIGRLRLDIVTRMDKLDWPEFEE